jgi:hypothetical protein
MSLILNRKLLNKDFILLVVDLNKDIIQKVEELDSSGGIRVCLNPISPYLPPFFLRFVVSLDGKGSVCLTDVPDPAFKGYVQLHLNPTAFTCEDAANDPEKVVITGDLFFSNTFPTMIDTTLKKIKDKMFTRLKIFVASI